MIWTFSWSKLLPLLKFSLPHTGFYSLRYAYQRSDVIIVGKVLGGTYLGYYSVAMDLARIPMDKAVSIINQVCFPVFAEIKHDSEALKRYYFKITEFISLLIFPVGIGAAVLSKDFVFLILSPRWEPVSHPLMLLCLVAILQSLAGGMSTILSALGKSQVNFRFSLVSAIVLPGCFWVGVQYGIIGVAIAWAAVYPLIFLFLFKRFRREIQATSVEFLNATKIPLYGALLMGLGVITVKSLIGWNDLSFGNLLLHVVVGIGIYSGYLFVFSSNTIDEIKLLYSRLRA